MYILIYFLVDSDADIVNFDPFAQKSQVKTNNENLLGDYENIAAPVNLLSAEVKRLHVNDPTARTVYIDDLDLKDFDPLSKEEIEEGIKSEKMISAELLKRSRDVVSNRASASKSWLERTLSQTLSPGTKVEVSSDELNFSHTYSVYLLGHASFLNCICHDRYDHQAGHKFILSIWKQKANPPFLPGQLIWIWDKNHPGVCWLAWNDQSLAFFKSSISGFIKNRSLSFKSCKNVWNILLMFSSVIQIR